MRVDGLPAVIVTKLTTLKPTGAILTKNRVISLKYCISIITITRKDTKLRTVPLIQFFF